MTANSTCEKENAYELLRKNVGEIMLAVGSDEWLENALEQVLLSKGPNAIEEYFSNFNEFLDTPETFHHFMRTKFKEKGRSHQSIFIAADISYGYGCKILSGEKKTKQRDVIIKICIAGNFELNEIKRALTLYEMPILSPRSKRDSVIMVAVASGIYDIEKINSLLKKYSMDSLYS